jgi:hypothetical protein
VYSDNRALVSIAAAVIFHIRDFRHDDIPATRTHHQLYVFYLQESPMHSGAEFYRIPPAFFNLTMTYRSDSDIHFPYDTFVHKTITDRDDEYSEQQVMAAVERKTKTAFAVSQTQLCANL